MRRKRTAGIFHIVKIPTGGVMSKDMGLPRPFPCGGPPHPSFSVHDVFSRAAPCRACPFCFPVRSGIPRTASCRTAHIGGIKLVLPNSAFHRQPQHRVSSRNTRRRQSVALFTIAHLFGISSKPRLTFRKKVLQSLKIKIFRLFFIS